MPDFIRMTDVDLAGNSLKAKNGTFSGDVVAATVTATSFAGDGSKLTGIKTPSGECKVAGEVVKGINADGSLKCIAALDPSALDPAVVPEPASVTALAFMSLASCALRRRRRRHRRVAIQATMAGG